MAEEGFSSGSYPGRQEKMKTEEVTLDSSVLVSALVKGEKFRPIARHIMEKSLRLRSRERL